MDEFDELEFRYGACGGMEYRNKYYRLDWTRVSGEMLLSMNADQLRKIADVMQAAIKGDKP